MKQSDHQAEQSSSQQTVETRQKLTANISYQDLVAEAGSHYKNPSWAAHMTPGLAPYSQLGMQLALHHHGNLLSPELYPKLKQAETELRRSMAQEFGFSHAQFTHGGTFSNLQALWQARNQSTADKKVIYGSEACHYSITKACNILGITFEAIPCHKNQQINLTTLERKCKHHAPIAIIANMGTTATGAIDPINEITDIAAKYSAWLHLDAAWGGFILLDDQYNKFKQYMHKVDSLTFDPHKSLFQPRPCSVLFSQLSPESDDDIDYLSETPEKALSGSYGGELFLSLWLNWKLLGKEWFIDKIRHRLIQANLFAKSLEEAGCHVIYHNTAIVCFRLNEEHELTALVKEGTVSIIFLNQIRYYRVVFAGLDISSEKLLKALRPFL